MARQLVVRNQAALQGRQYWAELTEADKKAVVITEYVEKFGALANRVVTPQVYEIFIEALGDLELRKIEKGLATYLREENKFPWPADLRNAIEEEV